MRDNNTLSTEKVYSLLEHLETSLDSKFVRLEQSLDARFLRLEDRTTLLERFNGRVSFMLALFTAGIIGMFGLFIDGLKQTFFRK